MVPPNPNIVQRTFMKMNTKTVQESEMQAWGHCVNGTLRFYSGVEHELMALCVSTMTFVLTEVSNHWALYNVHPQHVIRLGTSCYEWLNLWQCQNDTCRLLFCPSLKGFNFRWYQRCDNDKWDSWDYWNGTERYCHVVKYKADFLSTTVVDSKVLRKIITDWKHNFQVNRTHVSNCLN